MSDEQSIMCCGEKHIDKQAPYMVLGMQEARSTLSLPVP